jgi:hypothetical protein
VGLCFLKLCVVTMIAWGVCQAQPVPADSAAVQDSSASRVRVLEADTLHLLAPAAKSPGLAMLCSAIVPGAGQVYNESYWKAPLVLGLGIYFAAGFFRDNRSAENYRQLYLASQASGGNAVYRQFRDYYKNLRDANAWYFVIVYVLNIVDAYVDASLYGFDVSPALSFRGPQSTLGLSFRMSW